MKGITNAPLSVGDRIMCLYMEGETSVTPGTLGKVTAITKDPFEKDSEIISVKWDNGSSLSLLTVTDAWKKIVEDKINESRDSAIESFKRNKDIFKHFDWRFLRNFLYKMRDSGIVNMFGAAPLIYAGKDHIDRYYGEGREDEEEFQAVLEDADESKDKIVQGVISYMIKHKKDLDNMDMVNQYARNFSQKILGLYITLAGMTGNLS